MTEVVIYSKNYCPYCQRVKALLDEKGVKYQEIDITYDEAKQKEMMERSGRTTVPEIFIDGRHIGGCNDLYKLEEKGKLDKLLMSKHTPS